MTDLQILTLVIGITFPVVALLYSNKRFDDFQKRFDEFEKRIDEKLDNGFEHMELLLKLHEAEHHK